MLRQQKGFGIVELLVGIAVGMIVVAAAMTLLQTTLRSSNDNIKMARLEQELRQVMQMVSRDLRRATYWDKAVDVTKVSLTSPIKLSAKTGSVSVTSSTSGALASIGIAAKGGTLVHVGSDGTVYKGSITDYSSGTFTVSLTGTWPDAVIETDGISKGTWTILRPESVITAGANCVLLSYDRAIDGAYGTSDRRGYRLDGENAIEVRTSDSSSANDCDDSGGTANWQNLTDENYVSVTTFLVEDYSPDAISSSGMNVQVREYTITITGSLKSDSTVTRTLRETIKVRNDSIS